MKRLLFVDDEENVLEGLRNVLRKERKRWDMVFALGADAGLTEAAKQPFDVVISDMRMPGMDGAEFLKRIMALYPQTVRMILSGHSEREAAVRALPVAHQFINKPCDADPLRAILSRACGLQDLIVDERIRRLVGRIDRLPSAPQTYWELTAAASSPAVGAPELGKIVECDPGMSIKVLQLVNSPYFGLARPMSSVSDAIAYLGVELIKGLALSSHVFAMESLVTAVPGFSLAASQRVSLATSVVARALVDDRKLAEEAFTSGLIGDVGKIILAMGVPVEYSQALQSAKASGVPEHVAERALFGVSHAEVGGYLLGIWGLPLAVVEAVTFRDTPSLAQSEGNEALVAVHFAHALVQEALGIGKATGDARQFLDLEFLKAKGLEGRLDDYRARAKKPLERSLGL